jgi:hypothetical protein
MKPSLAVWVTLPCTRCIKIKGCSPEEANRRSSINSYYCKECSRDYQRARTNTGTDQLIRHHKYADFDHLLNLTYQLESNLPLPIPIPDPLSSLVAEVVSQIKKLHLLIQQHEQYAHEAKLQQDTARHAELVQALQLALQYRHQNPDLEKEILRTRKELEKLGYDGPEMIDAEE